MRLDFDPGENQVFWDAVHHIDGFPSDEKEMPIQKMIFESDALFQLPRVLDEVGASQQHLLVVVMDSTQMKRGSEVLKPKVVEILKSSGWLAEPVVLEPDASGQVHTTMTYVDQVRSHLRAESAALSLGSGTVTDITKHACYLFEQESGHRIPYVVYQTANSVSAYTSNMAPVFVNGVKRTLPSRYADALVADLETLCSAPREMTVAGVGDLLAAFVSFPDWNLAHRLGFAPGYTRLPQKLMGPLDEIFLAEAHSIRTSAPDGMAVLAKLIALGGLAMSLSRATSPLSGFEHVISHILDLLAEEERRPLAQHGTQVALAAVLGAETYHRFLEAFEPAEVVPDRCYPDAKAMYQHIQKVFAGVDPSGEAGQECWNDYEIKLDTWNNHRADFKSLLAEWETIKREIQEETRPPDRLIEILRAVDAPLIFDEMVPPAKEDQVHFAFLNAPLMRRRLTIGDLLIFLSWDRDSLWPAVWRRTQRLEN